METQFIQLNMIPSGVNPCFHVSQYDIGRSLGFMIYNGSEVVDLDSYTCTIEATRSDGVAITASVATDDNVGTFETTATMTNKTDKYRAQFVIVDGDSNRIASLPFDMEVIKAAMDENSEAIEEDASLYQQYTEAVQGAIAEANADIQAEENARIAAVNAEATARQNADNTLRSNIDAEATARVNAITAEATARQTSDNTLQGNINSEAATRASADSNLQSQINQIIAPSGEAPSAAEVQNARIGADGVTYSTLGDAIRTQVTDLKGTLTQLGNNQGLSNLSWEQGGIVTSSGINYSTQDVIRSGFNVIDFDKIISINVESGYYARLYAFTDQTTYNGAYNINTATKLSTASASEVRGSLLISRLPKGYKWKVCLKKDDGTTIAVEEKTNIYFQSQTDKELQLSDVPADAKETGDRLNALNDSMVRMLSDETAENKVGYITASGTVTPQSSGNFRYAELDVQQSDIIIYSGDCTGYWTSIWGYKSDNTAVALREALTAVEDYTFQIRDPTIVKVRAWSDSSQKNLVLQRVSASYESVKAFNAVKNIINAVGKNKIVYVALDGTGDFTTIQEAWAYINENGNSFDGWTIYIKNGLYEIAPRDVSHNSGIYFGYVNLNIVGESRENVIIRMTNTNALQNKVLDIGGNFTLENVTIECLANNITTDLGHSCYCIHIDRRAPEGHEPTEQFYSTVKNCKLIGQCHSPAGCGLHDKQIIRFVDCEFVSEVNSQALTSQGAIYIHSSTDASADDMGVEIINCIAVSKDGSNAIALSNVSASYGSKNFDEIPVTICRTIAVSNGALTNVSQATHMMTEECALNNVDALNYSAE